MNEEFISSIELLEYAFQPIVNIHNGICYGYEVLLRNYKKAGYSNILDVFDRAYTEKTLFKLEIALRNKALVSFVKIKEHDKLRIFYNIDNRVLSMPDYKPGITNKLLKDYNLLPDAICFEISERHDLGSSDGFLKSLQTYKKQQYKIAIDDFGTGYSGLKLLYMIEPDFIKIDRFFISDIEKDSKKKLFVARIINIAHTLGISVIAEGIETEKEYLFCKEIGCDYAQGYLIQEPTSDIKDLKIKYEHIGDLCREDRRKKNRDYQFIINQLEYLEPIKLYCNDSEGQSTKISDVFEIFRRNKDHNFFPVINSKDEPVGLIREKDLKEYVYSKYGKDLLMNRNISKNIFDFIVKCPICEASMKIERLIESYAVEEFPEGIIITQNGRYVGFLSAQAVLKVLNEKNIALARDQNPLTRLPGNILINEYIQQALEDIRNEYILVYFDFNNFKAFNDKYGFRQGDRAILLFADILNKANHLNRFFIGHIGGDDFFAGFKTEDIEFDEILRIIQEITNKFTKNVQSLYDEEDRRRGYIISSDRDGVEKQFPLMDMVSCILHLPINRSIMTVEELGLIIADLKKYAKTSGTNIVLFKVKNGYIIDCENFP